MNAMQGGTSVRGMKRRRGSGAIGVSRLSMAGPDVSPLEGAVVATLNTSPEKLKETNNVASFAVEEPEPELRSDQSEASVSSVDADEPYSNSGSEKPDSNHLSEENFKPSERRFTSKMEWTGSMLGLQCMISNEVSDPGGHKIIKAQKQLPSVAYGCISIADEPGRTLVRGSLLMKPYKTITQFPHHTTLRTGFADIRIEEMNLLQRSVAPHILRGDDCFIIGGRACGKTLSYLAPIIGCLIESYEEQAANKTVQKKEELDDKGPVCIIICYDSRAVMKITDYLYHFLNSSPNHKLVYGSVLKDDKESRRKLQMGIDILVTTVSFAAELCRKTHYFSYEKLRFLVFDDVDVTLRSAEKDFEKVQSSSINFVLKHPKRTHYQRVFCAHEWSPEVESLYFRIPGLPDPRVPAIPVLLIQSRNQAIRYSKMKLQFHHVTDELKIHRIMGLLNPGSGLDIMLQKHILIVCSTPALAILVHKELGALNVNASLAEMETMTTDDVLEIIRRWEDRDVCERRIMVVHDGILKGLPIHNVTCLIHYDLPCKPTTGKSSAGAERFSTMWGFFRDITDIKLHSRSKDDIPVLTSHFLLTGTEKELYKLQQFGAKLNAKMPLSLDKIADEMGLSQQQSRKMCPGIELYGRCVEPAPDNCSFRHEFTLSELNETPLFPRSGEVEVQITKCYNPSHYFGKILRYYELRDGMKYLRNSYINTFNKRTEQLNSHYKDEENKIPLESFDAGTVCAVETGTDGEFTRAKIESVTTRDYGNHPNMVKVFCMDTGEFRNVQAEDLWALPEEFVNLNPLSVRIILAHLQPFEGSTDYTGTQIHTADDIVMNKILNGKIRFSLGNTVWVDPLVELKLDSTTKKAIKGCSVRADIVRQHAADNNDLHIKLILDLTRSVGFTCAEFDSEDWVSDPSFMNLFFQPENRAEWAFVDSSTISDPNPVEIWPSLVKHPGSVFGTIGKFDSLLENLNEDLHQAVEQIIKDRCPNYNNQFINFFEIDLVVSAKDVVDERWRRAVITDKCQGDTEAETFFEVFFVDIGDRRSEVAAKEIFPIPIEFVNRLPFQVIQFKLEHIEPVDIPSGESNNGGDWTEEAISKLQQMLLDDNYDSLRMDVVAFKSSNNGSTPSRSYSAMFFDSTGEEVGSKLVSQGAAKFVQCGEERVTTVKNKLLAKYNRMYDERNQAANSTDDDMESEEEEVGAGFDDRADRFDDWEMGGLDMFAQEIGLLREPKNGYKRVNSFQNADEPHVSTSPITQQHNEPVNDIIPPPSSSPAEVDEEVAAPCLPMFSEILHPTVLWRQSTTQFILKINLPDIRDYTLKIDHQLVSFRTIEPPGYGFDISCYGRVEASAAEEFLTGQFLRIKLNKRIRNWTWPSALEDNKKYMWFKMDHDYLENSGDEADTEDNDIPVINVNEEEEVDSEAESSDEEDDFLTSGGVVDL